MTPEQAAQLNVPKNVAPKQEFKVVPPPIAPASQTSEPGTEAAIAHFISLDSAFDHVAEHPLKSEHFSVRHWGLVFSAARAIFERGYPTICLTSINKWINDNCLREFTQAIGQHVPWQKWPSVAQEEGGAELLSPANIRESMSGVLSCYALREDHKIRKDLYENALSREEANERWDKLAELNGQNGNLPPIIDAFDLCNNQKADPDIVIEGILHQGCKMVLGGGSKSFKTWMLLELAIASATGGKWLGFNVLQGKVAYLNFELPEFAIKRRIASICSALAIPVPKGMLKTWNLRGYSSEARSLLPKLGEKLKNQGFTMAIIDPLYKLRPGLDDNSTGLLTTVMNSIDEFSLQTGASIIYGEHFAKGTAALKDPIDRISGSGVQARDPDAIGLVTKHKEHQCFTIEFILRCFEPIESFVVKREHPLMVIQEELDPEELKQAPHAGGRPNASDERRKLIIQTLRNHGSLLQGKLHEITNIPLATLKRDLKTLIESKEIFRSEIDAQYAIR